MNAGKIQKYLPHIAVGLTVAYFGYFMVPPSNRSADFNYHDFGRLPVIGEGRYKPIDTVARMNLMIITHRQTFYDYDADKRYPATKWLLDVQTTPQPSGDDQLEELFPKSTGERSAWHQKIFRIENDQLMQFLKLERREGLRYSFLEIAKDRTASLHLQRSEQAG